MNKLFLFHKMRCVFVVCALVLSPAPQAQTNRSNGGNQDFTNLAESYYQAGDIHCTTSQLDSAQYYFDLALAMHTRAVQQGTCDKEKLDQLLIDITIGYAEINYYHGKYDLSLKEFFKALELAEKLNKQKEMAPIYYSIAEVYFAMYNYSQVETYYLKADQIYRALNDSAGIAEMYMRLSGVYILTENVQKGLEYAEEAFRIAWSMPDAPFQLQLWTVKRLCDVWLMMPDFDKALDYALKSVEIARQSDQPSDLANSLYQLSLCYKLLKRYKEAEEAAFLSLATDSTDTYINTNNYGIIASANLWLNNPEKADKYFLMQDRATKELARKNFQASVSEMEVKYETEKKELQIAALREEKRLMNWLSIAGGGLLLLGLLSFFSLWRLTVQKHRIAKQQNEIDREHILRIEQEKQLIATQAVLDGETQERSRLAHDLHDGLGSMLTGVKLNLELLKDNASLGSNELGYFDKSMQILHNSMVEMRRVAHHLMPDTLDRYGLKAALSGFLRDIPVVEFAWFGSDDRLTEQKTELIIYRIIHELVNNALKHAGATKIGVNIMREPDYIAFTVFDNGCGFDASTEPAGMGLSNIRKRIASCNGRISINSKAGEGTEVNGEIKI